MAASTLAGEKEEESGVDYSSGFRVAPAAVCNIANSSSEGNRSDDFVESPPFSSRFTPPLVRLRMPESNHCATGDYPAAHYVNEEGNRAVHRVFQFYFYGQLSNVIKAAIWWSTFGVFAEALTQWQLAVGVTRLAFNAALVSPVAGTAAESVPIQKLLRVTTTGRCGIWCFLIPLAWYLVAIHFECRSTFAVVFLGIMLVDGLLVSFANVVDVDCGGLDTFAAQLGLTASAALKEKFTQIHQRIFDLSFVCLTPLIALVVWALAVKFDCRGLQLKRLRPTRLSENFDIAMLVGGVCIPVGILSAVSLYCYHKSSEHAKAFPIRPIESAPTLRLRDALKERLREVWEGLRAVMAEAPLCWRLTFLACETALEDAVVSIMFPQVALHAVPVLYNTWFDLPQGEVTRGIPPLVVPGGWTFVNLFAVVLIALGKLGGMVAGCYSTVRWVQPTSIDSAAYKKLMLSILLSGVCLIFFPLGLLLVVEPTMFEPLISILHLEGPRTRVATSVLLMLTGSFLYFVFVTAPKFGLANLLQAVAAQGNVDSQVFSFVGTYVTATDALVILLLSWNFSCHPFLRALLLTVAAYVVYGLVEVLLSPRLILRPVALRAELDDLSLGSMEYPGLSSSFGGGAHLDLDFALDARSNFKAWNDQQWSETLRPMAADNGARPVGSWA